MAFGPISVPSLVPVTEPASSMCQGNRNGLYPVGGKVIEKLGEEIPALVWMKDPTPTPVQDLVTGTDGLPAG